MDVISIWVRNFWKDEEGLGTLEILLIVAVLVGVALLFRTQIMDWVDKLLKKSDSEIDQF